MDMVPKTEEKNKATLPKVEDDTKVQGSSSLKDKIFDKDYLDKFLKFNYFIGSKFRSNYRRVLRVVSKRILSSFGRVKKYVVKLADKFKKSILDGITEFVFIFKRANDKYKKNKENVLNKRRSGVISGIIIGSFVLSEVLKLLLKFSLFILNYVAPVAAVAVLTFTVNYYRNITYGIEVSLNGESLGYIKNESIYKNAEKDMQQRIYLEGEPPLYTTPTFSIAVVSDEELLSTNHMANKIVQALSDDISKASGLYIDGAFYGATTDGEQLHSIIEGIRDSYRTGAKDEEISFVQQIQVVDDGYYLNATIQEPDLLTTIFHQEVETQRIYIVEQGDSPSFIANSNGLTTEQLLELNPGIDKNLQIGQEIVLNHSKPLMSIKRTVTEVVEEAIAYDEERVENASKAIGFAQVTQEGENGVAEVSRRVTYIDGVKTESNEIDRITVKAPINETIVLGTRDSRTGKNISLDELDEVKASGVFTWPVQSGGRITCGWLGYSGHRAIDIQSGLGDGTLAADDGVVVQVTYSNIGYGYHVIIDHLNGYRTLYGHNSKIYVEQGQTVKRGEVIAAQGRTGNVYGRTGIHLHFEVIKNGVKVNPLDYLVR